MGVSYFFHHFIRSGQVSSRGFLNYIPSTYSADGDQSTLLASMAAIGLLAMASSTRQPELVGQAHSKYAEAVRKVNAALASPVESTKDSTLMSVISLGIFEQVSQYRSWTLHVDGAVALVSARGRNQFSSPVTFHMFNQVRADLMISCIHGEKPFPKVMLDLQDEASKHTDSSNPCWAMGILGTRSANLLMAVRENKTTEQVPWHQLFEEATALDCDFQRLFGVLHQREPYIITHTPGADPSKAYNGRCDIYADFWAIRLWNNCRSLQMIVCQIKSFLLNKLFADNPAEIEDVDLRLETINATLCNHGDDILATIPQALELLSSEIDTFTGSAAAFHGNISGGYMLAWSLAMVGKSPATRTGTRKWVIQCLQGIGEQANHYLALDIAEQIAKIDQLAG